MIYQLNAKITRTFLSRLIGLIRVSRQKAAENTALFFSNCRAIHTFWMAKSIALIWVDEDFKVLKIEHEVLPGKIKSCRQAAGVFEFITGSKLFPVTIKIGDYCHVNNMFLQKSAKKQAIIKELEKSESGQALVEFALIMPIILVIIFGFIETARLISDQQKLTYVANYAVQTGSLTNDDLKISGAVGEFYDLSEVNVAVKSFHQTSAVEITTANRSYNDIVKVEVSYESSILVPFIDVSFLNLTAESSARVLCVNQNPPYTCLN